MISEDESWDRTREFYTQNGFLVISANGQIPIGRVYGTEHMVVCIRDDGSEVIGSLKLPVRVTGTATVKEYRNYRQQIGYERTDPPEGYEHFYKVEVAD